MVPIALGPSSERNLTRIKPAARYRRFVVSAEPSRAQVVTLKRKWEAFMSRTGDATSPTRLKP